MATARSRRGPSSAIWKTRKPGTGSSGVEAGGRIKPPEKALCDRIEKALELFPGEVWALAAPERLAALDADLVMWHHQQLDRARGFQMTPREQLLIQHARRTAEPAHRDGESGKALAARRAALNPLTEPLEHVLAALHTDRNANLEVDPAAVAYEALDQLAFLPARVQHQAWLTIRELARTAVAANLVDRS